MISKTARLAAGLVFAVLILVFASARFSSPISKRSPEIQIPTGVHFIKVKRAIDGDTLDLAHGERVRLIGVNTPEMRHPSKGVEQYGREAAAFTRQLVEGKKIRLEYDAERKDKYGRTLAYAYLEDGTFVNAELLRQGYAQTMTIAPNVKYVDLFVGLQREAREARRGLWRD